MKRLRGQGYQALKHRVSFVCARLFDLFQIASMIRRQCGGEEVESCESNIAGNIVHYDHFQAVVIYHWSSHRDFSAFQNHFLNNSTFSWVLRTKCNRRFLKQCFELALSYLFSLICGHKNTRQRQQVGWPCSTTYL